MELRDYIRIISKSWVLILVLTLVGVGSGATVSLLQPPTFSATAMVFVSTQSGGSASDLVQGSTFTTQRVITYSQLVSTPIVLLPVMASLHLRIQEENLAKQVTASATTDTSIIEITATDRDPVRAADIANATSQSLTAVVQQIESADAAGATTPVKLTPVQQADVPRQPVSPNVPLDLALGLLIGLVLGVGTAVLRETLETRIHNERDVEQITSVPILGGIVFDTKARERPLIVQVDPRSARAESFRTLRTNLQFLDADSTHTSFVITSSIDSEGKSTTAANLAIAIADSGAQVLLVDADLRRPMIASYMSIEGAVGLSDVVIGRAELKDVLQPWGRAKLSILPAGRTPPNPSELLGSARMEAIISELQRVFDVVIFDSPPLLPVTDAAILAKKVGGAIVVVAAGRTHKNQLRGAIATLDKVGATVSGLVLTMLPTKGPDAYGYGQYGYGYAARDDEVKPSGRVQRAG